MFEKKSCFAQATIRCKNCKIITDILVLHLQWQLLLQIFIFSCHQQRCHKHNSLRPENLHTVALSKVYIPEKYFMQNSPQFWGQNVAITKCITCNVVNIFVFFVTQQRKLYKKHYVCNVTIGVFSRLSDIWDICCVVQNTIFLLMSAFILNCVVSSSKLAKWCNSTFFNTEVNTFSALTHPGSKYSDQLRCDSS